MPGTDTPEGHLEGWRIALCSPHLQFLHYWAYDLDDGLSYNDNAEEPYAD